MSFFSHSSYKDILKGLVSKDQGLSFGRQVRFTDLAEAAGVQKTYLSRALNTDEVHLSADQLFLAIEYLGLGPEERDFTMLLHEWERARVYSRKHILEEKIRSTREKNNRTDKHIITKTKEVGHDKRAAYYLDPNMQIVHMMFTLSHLRAQPDRIREALQLSVSGFDFIVSQLVDLSFLKSTQTGYIVCEPHVHLSSTSLLHKPYQMLNKIKLLENIGKGSHSDNYHFNVYISADERTRNELRNRFYIFLKDAEKLIRNAPSDEVYQMCFDLVQWT